MTSSCANQGNDSVTNTMCSIEGVALLYHILTSSLVCTDLITIARFTSDDWLRLVERKTELWASLQLVPSFRIRTWRSAIFWGKTIRSSANEELNKWNRNPRTFSADISTRRRLTPNPRFFTFFVSCTVRAIPLYFLGKTECALLINYYSPLCWGDKINQISVSLNTNA